MRFNFFINCGHTVAPQFERFDSDQTYRLTEQSELNILLRQTFREDIPHSCPWGIRREKSRPQGCVCRHQASDRTSPLVRGEVQRSRLFLSVELLLCDRQHSTQPVLTFAPFLTFCW